MSKRITRILCIDPAQSVTGWAILDLYPPDKKTNTSQIVVHATGLIKSSQEANRVAYGDEVNRFTKTVVTLDMLKNSVRKVIEKYKPNYAAIEDAFYHPKRPSAYASLLQCICSIGMMCKEHFNLPLTRIPTRLAKKCLYGSGAAVKKDIISAVKEIPVITFKHEDTKTNLVEHEADSVAVGYCYVLEYLPGIKQFEFEVANRVPKGGK